MNLNDYQLQTKTTVSYSKEIELEYLTLGLISELMEYKSSINEIDGKGGIKEYGDCCWYLARLCTYFNLNFKDTWEEVLTIKQWQTRAEKKVNNNYNDLAIQGLSSTVKKFLRGDFGERALALRVEINIHRAMIYLQHRNIVDQFSLEKALEINASKLQQRKANNTIKGDGDNR